MLALCLLGVATGAAGRDPVPSAGARSLGDPFYPTLGNGGYDVQAYDLDLTWHRPDAARPQGEIAGIADIDLRTTRTCRRCRSTSPAPTRS